MLTNDDLKVIADTIEYLSMLRGSKAIYFCDELDKVYCKIINKRKVQNKNSNEYNKNNRKYHNLVNQLSYHRKRGNQARVRELEIKLNELKNSTI